jgi:membrane-bound lytic murein transglycosylase F
MMLTRATADSLGVNDRLDLQESIQGGALYLQQLMAKVPDSVPVDERIWFSLAAYNMGRNHILDACNPTKMQQGNQDSWLDVKQRLPMLSHKRYHSQLTYGYARGREAFHYVENIRRYQVSLVGYLQEKEKRAAQDAAN